MKITSPQNPRVKAAVRLREKKDRKKAGVFIVEGAREIARAVARDFQLKELFLCSEELSPEAKNLLPQLQLSDDKQLEVTPPVFAKLAMREDKDGLFAIFAEKRHTLAEISDKKNPLFIVLETVEKPGNLGAILRTADGAGVTGVIVLDPSCDIYNPNAIRASVGAIFSVPVIQLPPQEWWSYCAQQKIQTIAATPNTNQTYFDVDYRKPSALFLGSEAHGLTQETMDRCEVKIKIPMAGLGDSLNISVAGAVIIYEAVRQRLQT